MDPTELESEIRRLTSGRGADAVLVTAASKSAAPLALATTVARDRAHVVVVGDVAIESPRAPLFAKELRLMVSRSYGPGRYDPVYEQDGVDYPASYVRWTEGRNLAEVLRLMAADRLRPSRLTTHVVDLDDGSRCLLLPGVRGVVARHPASLRLKGGEGNAEHSAGGQQEDGRARCSAAPVPGSGSSGQAHSPAAF